MTMFRCRVKRSLSILELLKVRWNYLNIYVIQCGGQHCRPVVIQNMKHNDKGFLSVELLLMLLYINK